jgi:ABC-type oligopeptide transport system substrate-binding subunit
MMKRLKILLIIAALAAALPLMQACSSQQSSPPPDTQTQAQPAPPPSDPGEPDSVLGSAFHFVGTVVLFPFRLIGDTLGLLV